MARRTVSALLLALALAAPAALAAAETTAPPRPDAVDLGGTPVEGGTAQEPTTITAGLWSDTLTGPGQSEANTRWFRYQRVIADSTVLIGAVATSQEEYGDQIQVVVSTRDGVDCDTSDTATSRPSTPGSAYGAVAFVGLEETGDGACAAAPELDIAVRRGTTSDVASDSPFVLRVVEEAPITPGAGPEPAAETALVPTEPVAATPTRGGASFDDAPTVDGTVGDDLPPGTERFWKVHLGWGQQLSWGLEVSVRPPPENFVVAPSVEVTLYDPLRTAFEGGAVDNETSGSYGDEGASLFDTTPPVAYLNRFESDEVAFVPGDYWVGVSVSPAEEQTTSVPVELTVDVVGEETAPPAFLNNVTGPGGVEDGPEDYDRSTPYLVDEGTFRADISGTPTSPDDEAGADEGVRRALGLGVGAGSLVSLLAGALLLRRRARLSRPAAR